MNQEYYTREEIMEFHDDAEKEQSWGDLIFHYEDGRIVLIRTEFVNKKSSRQRTTRRAGGSYGLERKAS